MASIVQNIIGDQAVQIGNEEFVRKLSFGGSWNYCKVGLLMRVFGDTTVNNCRFQIGFNSGDQNTLMSNNCAGYVGVKYCYNTVMSYDAVNKRFNVSSNYFNDHVQKQGATLSETLSAGATGAQYFAAATSAGPMIVVLTATRTTATTYTLMGTYASAAQIVNVPTQGDLLAGMDTEDLGRLGSFCTAGISKVSTGSLPSNMDTLSVYWNHNIPVLEIYAMSVVAYY
jgi:hypothetical protein